MKRAKSERLMYMGLKMEEERVLGVESRGEDRDWENWAVEARKFAVRAR